MANISTKDRKAWEKKLKNREVVLFEGNNFEAQFGFSYPRSYRQGYEPIKSAGDAKINGFPTIKF